MCPASSTSLVALATAHNNVHVRPDVLPFLLFLPADIDACAAEPCSNNNVGNVNCTDSPPPALADKNGRECKCDTGYNYVEGTGCVGERHC